MITDGLHENVWFYSKVSAPLAKKESKWNNCRNKNTVPKWLLLNHSYNSFLYIHNNLLHSAMWDKTVLSVLLPSTNPQGDSSRAFIITPRGNLETPHKGHVAGLQLKMNEGPVLCRRVGDGGTVSWCLCSGALIAQWVFCLLVCHRPNQQRRGKAQLNAGLPWLPCGVLWCHHACYNGLYMCFVCNISTSCLKDSMRNHRHLHWAKVTCTLLQCLRFLTKIFILLWIHYILSDFNALN